MQEKIDEVTSEKDRTIEALNNTQEEEISQLKENHAKQLSENGKYTNSIFLFNQQYIVY